jgi:hypothetical protein
VLLRVEQRICDRSGRVKMVPGGLTRWCAMKMLDLWVWMSRVRAVLGFTEMKGLKRGFRDSKARGCRILGKFATYSFHVGLALTIVASILSNSGHKM